jgi:hypothetical protein
MIDRMFCRLRTWSRHGFEDGNIRYFRESNTDLPFTLYHPVAGSSARVNLKTKLLPYRPVSGLGGF